MPEKSLPTLADLATVPQRLEIICNACRRDRVLMPPEEAVERFGATTTFVRLRQILKCSQCNAKGREGAISVRGSVEDYYAAIERRQDESNRILYGEEGAALIQSYRTRF